MSRRTFLRPEGRAPPAAAPPTAEFGLNFRFLRSPLSRWLASAAFRLHHSLTAAPKLNLLSVTAADMNVDSSSWMGRKLSAALNFDAFAATAHIEKTADPQLENFRKVMK